MIPAEANSLTDRSQKETESHYHPRVAVLMPTAVSSKEEQHQGLPIGEKIDFTNIIQPDIKKINRQTTVTHQGNRAQYLELLQHISFEQQMTRCAKKKV